MFVHIETDEERTYRHMQEQISILYDLLCEAEERVIRYCFITGVFSFLIGLYIGGEMVFRKLGW